MMGERLFENFLQNHVATLSVIAIRILLARTTRYGAVPSHLFTDPSICLRTALIRKHLSACKGTFCALVVTHETSLGLTRSVLIEIISYGVVEMEKGIECK